MRIYNLLPVVDTGFWTSEMDDYIKKFLLPDTEIVNGYLTGGPSSIEGEYDEVLAGPDVVFKCIQAEKDGFDAIFVNCFGDPAVRAAREAVNIPVFGGFEPAVQYALGIADKIGIVTVLPEVIPMIRGNIAKAGLTSRLVSLRYVNIPVLGLHDLDDLAAGLINESIKAIEEDGAEMILLGCTAMVGVKEKVEDGLAKQGYDIVLIELAQAALVMLETYVRMGLTQSGLTYRPPAKKLRKWWGGDTVIDI
jgi:allantoin racemase